MLGFQKPEYAINQTLKIFHGGWTPTPEIVGVIENYHQRSLENAYEPILFFPTPNNGNVLVKLSATSVGIPQALESVREAWSKTFPGNPFDYFFLQDFYQQQYQSEERFSKASRLGTIVTVWVALLGLIALISTTTLKKRKEIGIRKVLGASVNSILLLLTRRLILLVILACALALPIAYGLVTRWLENYAFRVELSGWLFIIPTLVIIILVILTLSYHTWRAARTNPVNVLRYE